MELKNQLRELVAVFHNVLIGTGFASRTVVWHSPRRLHETLDGLPGDITTIHYEYRFTWIQICRTIISRSNTPTRMLGYLFTDRIVVCSCNTGTMIGDS